MIVSRTAAERLLGKSLKGLGAGKRSYYVLSEDGDKNLGGPYTKEQAKKRLGQVEYFKHNPERRRLYIYPNEASRKVARHALDRRKELPRSKRGGLDAAQAHEQGIGSGVMRARDIASGKRINAYQVKAFFDRHRHNYVKARADGKRWEDSKAWQAWDLWGGEPLRRQVESAVRKDRRTDRNSRSENMKKKSVAKNPQSTKERPYTIYLVQDKPRGLVLYSFESGDLISPSASASEYSWLLGESAIEESGTHIFTSEAKLRNFLCRSGKRIVRGRPRYPNPRNSKVKDALSAEATRYENFNDFSNAYWNACSRGLYWFATNERRFHIGLQERKRIDKGTFTVACSPALALKGRNEGKKYVAELDVTSLPDGSIKIKRGAGGSEIKIVGHPGSIKITRVLDATKAKKAFKWQLSILPSSKEELRSIWEKAWEKRRREARKTEIRKQKRLERELKRAEARAKEEAEAAIREERKAKKKAVDEKNKRVSAGKAAQSRKRSAKRVMAGRAVVSEARRRKEERERERESNKKKTAKRKAAKKKTARGKRVIVGPAEKVRKPNPSRTRLVRVNVNKPSG